MPLFTSVISSTNAKFVGISSDQSSISWLTKGFSAKLVMQMRKESIHRWGEIEENLCW